MAQDAEMTAGTACGERQVPGPRGSSFAASLSFPGSSAAGGFARTQPGCASFLPAWESSFRNT